ncbi:pentatricopeptide repeat-containing protein At5g66520-like [Tasmannia lanceolata]|uniref:pentatricopeptide repeat-containing protein At5g66520-like n=1 Tax=Tasmannia lanceolata TaxID=3420 RepID=UPI0040646706
MTSSLNTTRKLLFTNDPIHMLLDSCKSMRELKQIHAHIIKEDPSLCSNPATTKAISFCAISPHGNIDYAKTLFNKLQSPTIFSWNSLIRGLSISKNPLEAITFYHEMLHRGFRPNKFTFPFVIKACTELSSIQYGIIVHTHVVKMGLELDSYVQSSLIHMYANGQELEAARELFDNCSQRDVVSWNSMIDGYVKCGELDHARLIFDRMDCKDVVSWNTMINGYAIIGSLDESRKLFDEMPKRNVISWNSMLAAYTKCGDAEGACRVFDEMPLRDVVSWNAMLACYAQCGRSNEALALFEEMRAARIKPTDATIVSMLSACAHLGALDQGARLHEFIDRHKIALNTIMGTALVDMYAKCGCLPRAVQVFDAIELKDLLAWNTIIAGMAMHGHAKEAHRLFNEMQESGVRPDDITLVAVLSACSHAGMVEEGRRLLNCMSGTYGIDPKVEHYGCVIDLLARAGLLEEAVDLIGAMPMEPNANAWGALLGGCRIHGNIAVGERVGKRLLELQPHHSGRYVLLSNIYAAANRWDDAKKVRNLMKSKGIAKVPGLSMIEFEGIVHRFVAGDRSHPESNNIYNKLSEISERLKISVGYSPDTKQVLFDIEEEEKEHALFVHSEKLAIAFGLIHMGTDTAIRVVKNLRVCRDCHNVTKLISEVYDREIIVRDRNRFHRFVKGRCSCMDYW